tara:strand:- start:252 stop:710 length:459 start_codon:yes stop_codon:yes gene_type:complete
MAHFSKIGLHSKVISVQVVSNSDLLNADGVEEEEIGRQFLERIHGWPFWVQTSYNTRGGKHYTDGAESADQTKALRKNYAGIGYIWDEDKDMFYEKQPYASWTFNEGTGLWDSPTPKPETESDGVDKDGNPIKIPDQYTWNELTTSWDKIIY